MSPIFSKAAGFIRATRAASQNRSSTVSFPEVVSWVVLLPVILVKTYANDKVLHLFFFHVCLLPF